MTIKVAINGMGRIGRSTLAAIIESGRSDIEVVSINAPAPIETLVHLMKYDSVHGRFPGDIKSLEVILTLAVAKLICNLHIIPLN